MKQVRWNAFPLLVTALAIAAPVVAAAPVRAQGLTSVRSFGTGGSGPGQFAAPEGVAVSGGLVYVADFLNNRIDRFDPNHFAATFTSFGIQGAGPGR
jgi:hypothetical protein